MISSPSKGRWVIANTPSFFLPIAINSAPISLRSSHASPPLTRVEAYTEYRHHCETLDREGYTYAVYSDDDSDEGKEREIRMIKPHPAAMMKADAWKRLRAMLAEFGMTPSSRSKVSKDKPDDDDLLSQFLNSRD